MQSQYIALVPEAGGVSPSELLRVSAALQKQISSQFGPFWELQATVDAFAELEDVPAGYRPIVLSQADVAGVAPGIHLDENGQPYARLILAPGWSIAASRVCMEMLVNPFGQRTLAATSPRTDQGPAEVLVEVCGAFGDAPRAYAVNDVPVSDFCTPAYFDAHVLRGGERYSFRGGAFTAPLQLLRGGHLAWFDAITNSWWLRTFHEEHPSDLSLGSMRPSSRTVRALIMAHAPMRALSAHHHEPLDARVGLSWLREQASMAYRARAEHLRVLLSGAIGAADGSMLSAPVELPASAMASPSFGRLRAVESPWPVREPTRNFEHELRDVVASGIDAAEQHDDLDSGEDESELSASQFLDSEPVVAAPAPSPTIVPPKSRPASNGARTVAAAKVAARPAARPAAREQTAREQSPSADSAREASIPGTRPSVPPPLHGRPSSIAPVAMLDSARRSDGSRLGTILIGAAALALAVAGFVRSGNTTAPAPVAATAPQAPQVRPAASVASAPAPAPAASAPATVASPAEPVAPARAVPPAPVAKATQQPSKADTGTKSAARDGASEKREKRRASKEAAATPETDNATPKAQPVAAIENLFETRR
jgi:hypothetical protein